jgi:hypothetical protein
MLQCTRLSPHTADMGPSAAWAIVVQLDTLGCSLPLRCGGHNEHKHCQLFCGLCAHTHGSHVSCLMSHGSHVLMGYTVVDTRARRPTHPHMDTAELSSLFVWFTHLSSCFVCLVYTCAPGIIRPSHPLINPGYGPCPGTTHEQRERGDG